MDDSYLRSGCLERDPQAWVELVQMVERLARGLAAPRYNLSASMVEDIAQITMVEILKNDMRLLRDFQGRSALSTYLGTIVLRIAGAQVRAIRREQSLDEMPDPDYRAHSYRGHASLPQDVALNRLTYQEIFENLNPVDRTILMLTADGYPAQEIAQIVTRRHRQPFNAASVRKRKERALRALRRNLKQEMLQA